MNQKYLSPTLKLVSVATAVGLFNLIFYRLGIPYAGTLGFAVLIFAVNLFTTIVFAKKLIQLVKANDHKDLRHLSLSFAVTLLSTWISLNRASWTDRSYLSVIALLSSAYTFYLLARPTVYFSAFTELFFYPVELFRDYVSSIWRSLKGIAASVDFLFNAFKKVKPKSTESTNASAIIRGVIISGAVLFLIVPLLMSADAAFAKFIEDLFNINIPFNLSDRLIFSIILAAIATPATFMRFKTAYASPFTHKNFKKFPTEISIAIFSVTAVLGIFLLIQFPYLFSAVGDEKLAELGITTYSEYVRKGFTELSQVSIIIYSLAGLGYLVSRQQDQATQKAKYVKWLTFALLCVALVFVASIFRRVGLYMSYHGLTLARYYGLLVLLGLSGWTLSLVGRLLYPTKFHWRYVEFGLAWVVVAIPTVLPPERLITGNYQPTVNNEIDYTYIARLDADAVEGWIEAYKQTEVWQASHSELFNSTKINQEELRILRYHEQIYIALEQHWFDLSRIYGDQELVDITCNTWGRMPVSGGCTGVLKEPRWYHTNLAERDAFVQLKTAMNPSELILKRQTLAEFLNQVDVTGEAQPPDRSLDSPLL